MGMNYYLVKRKNLQKRCNDSSIYSEFKSISHYLPECFHIGKASYGWHFSLCQYPNQNIFTLKDWRKLFRNKEYVILNEELRELSSRVMLNIICRRKGTVTRKEYNKMKTENVISNAGYDSKHKLMVHRTIIDIFSNHSYFEVPGQTYDITPDVEFS